MPIGKLIDFFRTSFEEPPANEEEHEYAIRLATAAVLLEVAHAGSDMGKDEQKEVIEHLTSGFDLSGEAARELIDTANRIRSDTIDHFELTNRIRQSSSREDRMEIVRAMWRIVYADGKFHRYEGYLVRKLADLMGIEHGRMIAAKMDIRRELSLED